MGPASLGGPTPNSKAFWALLDWDNTLRRGFILREWTDFLQVRLARNSRAFYDLDDLFDGYWAGGVSYTDLAEVAPMLYAKALAGHEARVVASLASSFVEHDLGQGALFSFVEPFLKLLRDNSIDAAVVTGGPHEVIDGYRAVLPFGQTHGLKLATDGGLYNGEIELNTATADGKATVISELGIANVVLAVGDSASDMPLFEAAPFRIVVGSGEVLEMDRRTIRVVPDVAPEQTLVQLEHFVGSLRDEPF